MNPDKVIHIKREAKSYYQLDELNHFQGKLKSIDQEDFNKLKKSLVKDGLPIGFHVWVDKKKKVWTIDGHHRVLALKALRDDGYDVPSLPCVHVQAKDKKEAAKAVLINNSKYAKINQESLSDFMIGFELNLDDLNFLDLPDLNMDDFGLDEKTKEGLTDDDDVPEVAQNIHGVTLGDIYTLGNHRLMCGDSTSIDAVEKLMDGQKADMVFTDPPYNQETEGGFKGMVGKALEKQSSEIEHLCNFEPKEFLNILPFVFNKKMNALVFCNKDLVVDYLKWAKDSGYSYNILFWKKPTAIPIGGSYRPDVEYLLSFRKNGIFNSGKNDLQYSKCLEFGRESDKVHPTMKPVEMIENQIKICSNDKSIVVDLFGGSGSTLIACEKTNRKCFMMELDPHYCSVIIERWQNFTGLKAKLITE